MNLWHRFIATTDDDHECTQPGCGVIVDDAAMGDLTTPCPAPACGDEYATGGCVVMAGPHGPECSYCERPHGSTDLDQDDDLASDELDAEADAILAAAEADLPALSNFLAERL